MKAYQKEYSLTHSRDRFFKSLAKAVEPLIETCPSCQKELCECPSINRGSFAKYVEEDKDPFLE